MSEQMTNDGSFGSADAIVAWAAPLAYGRVFSVPNLAGDVWTAVIELLDLPGSVAVRAGQTVEHVGDGVFRLTPDIGSAHE